MQDKDVKVGMKVVPHSKSIDGGGLTCDKVDDGWQTQGFMYVNVIVPTGCSKYEIAKHWPTYYKLDKQKDARGNYYLASDFEPYIESCKEPVKEEKKSMKAIVKDICVTSDWPAFTETMRSLIGKEIEVELRNNTFGDQTTYYVGAGYSWLPEWLDFCVAPKKEEIVGMKEEDVKIGMKVVPIRKTVEPYYSGLEYSNNWNNAKSRGQEYLYVAHQSCQRDSYTDGKPEFPAGDERNKSFVLSQYPDSHDGDYFYASDFVPYIEKYVVPEKKVEERKMKVGDRIICIEHDTPVDPGATATILYMYSDGRGMDIQIDKPYYKAPDDGKWWMRTDHWKLLDKEVEKPAKKFKKGDKVVCVKDDYPVTKGTRAEVLEMGVSLVAVKYPGNTYFGARASRWALVEKTKK